MRRLAAIFWLGTKELRSFGHDLALLGLVVYSFTFAVYAQAQGTSQELRHAAIAVVDEDRSPLSRAIARALLPPSFKPPVEIAADRVDRLMDTGAFTFVLDFPPGFERDVRAGRRPAVQLLVDATAAMQAGIGAGYLQEIVGREAAKFASRTEGVAPPPVGLAVRVAYNPNVSTAWFMGVMAIVGNVTTLAIILAGAAVVREREHGTMDHLLVMPLTPFEIATAKIWANGLVITVAVGLSLVLVVHGLLAIPIAGSIPLFMAGTALYLFFATAVGLYLGTVARSMPQLGLLFMLVMLPLNLLSGNNTPLESMPAWLQTVMRFSPSTRFVGFAQSILFRGAGLDVVWPEFLAVALVGSLFLALALRRFRLATAAAGA